MQEINHAKNTAKLFQQSSLLDVLIEVEGFLDFLDLYVYPNWYLGQVVDGPRISRYWITVTLQYDFKKMPDPMGARVLHDVGVKVHYIKHTTMEPIEIKTPADFRDNSKKPKLEPKKFWLVELKIPRKLIDDLNYNDLEDIDEDDVGADVDIEDVSDAADEGITSDGEIDQNG